MAEDGDAVGHHNGVEAVVGLSSHHYAITGRQLEFWVCPDINALAGVLDKKGGFTRTPVGDDGLEGDRRIRGGLDVAEGVDSVQGCERGWRLRPNGQGVSENDQECGS